MKCFSRCFATVVLVLSFLLAAAPSANAQARARGSAPAQGQATTRGAAQGQGGGGSQGQGSQGQGGGLRPSPGSVSRQTPTLGMRQPPVQTAPRPAPPAGGAPQRTAGASRTPPGRNYGAVAQQAVPRNLPRGPVTGGVIVPGVSGARGDHLVYQPHYQPYYRGGRYYRPYYPPAHRLTYASPYYLFRPHFRLSFGFWAGYPVTYPYYFAPYPYAYAAPYAYPYSSGSYSVGTAPYSVQASPTPSTQVTPGGLSFEIKPPEAEVYVDGEYYGTVDQFSPTAPPLWLAPGRHRVEIRSPGYETIAFDVDILSGQVIPYQGDLRRF
jgi:PEGA domain-containing protein